VFFFFDPGHVHVAKTWGERLESIGPGLPELLDRHPDTSPLLPLARNPTVREPLAACWATTRAPS